MGRKRLKEGDTTTIGTNNRAVVPVPFSHGDVIKFEEVTHDGFRAKKIKQGNSMKYNELTDADLSIIIEALREKKDAVEPLLQSLTDRTEIKEMIGYLREIENLIKTFEGMLGIKSGVWSE